MANSNYHHHHQTKSFWNSFVLSIGVLFCVIYCHVGFFSEAAAIIGHHDGNTEEHPTSFTDGRPVNQTWISFSEATVASLGLLVCVVMFVLLCSGGCCLNIFGKRGNNTEVRIQGFDNPISELGPITISPIDVRALQTNVDAIVFERLPSVIDLTPIPLAPIVHRVSIPNNNNSSSPWEPAISKPPTTTIPSNVKKNPETTNSSKTLLLSVESFTQPQIHLNENNSKSLTPLPVSTVIHEQSKIKIDDNNVNGSTLSRNSPNLPNPSSHQPTSIPTPLENKTNNLLFQVTPKITTTTTTIAAAAAITKNITPLTSNQSSSGLSIPDVSFVIIPPTPIPIIVSEKEQVDNVKSSFKNNNNKNNTKILLEKTDSNSVIQNSNTNNNNNVTTNYTSLPTTSSNDGDDDHSSDYTTITTTPASTFNNVSNSSLENNEKESHISLENKSETDEVGKNESQQVNVNTIISARDISSSSCNSNSSSSSTNSNNISSFTIKPSIVKKLDFLESQEHSYIVDDDYSMKGKYNNSNLVDSDLKSTQEVRRKEEKVISFTPATTPLNLNEPTLYHALVQAPTKHPNQTIKENIKSYGLKNTFEYTFQDKDEVSYIPDQLNEEKEKNSSSSLNYIMSNSSISSSSNKSEQNPILLSEKESLPTITHISDTSVETSNGKVNSSIKYYEETSNEMEEEKQESIMYNIEREKVKQNIKEQRHYNPNLRKTSTPNNSPQHKKNLIQRNYNNEPLNESTEAEKKKNPTDFFNRTADDVFEDFSMEFSTQISPISKGSDHSNTSWGKDVKFNSSGNDDDDDNKSSNVVLGASDDLGLGFYQRVTTELDLENVPRNLNKKVTDDGNDHDQHDSSNYGIERVHAPPLFNSKVSLHTLPMGTTTTTTSETNYESNPMEICSSVNNTDSFASNHEEGECVTYHDTFDLIDKKFEKKKPTSTDSNHYNYNNDDENDENEKTVKPNQKNFLLKSNQNPITKTVIPRKLFTEGELCDETGEISKDTSDIPNNNNINNKILGSNNIIKNNVENSFHKDTNIIKASVPTTCASSSMTSGTSNEFVNSVTNNNTTVLNKATIDKNVIESNKTDSKHDESLPVNFKFGLTTILGESTFDNNSISSNMNTNNDKFVEDIQAEIEEYGSLVMTDLEDNEENPRKELVKETREEEIDYTSIQRVMAFEESSNKNSLIHGTDDPGMLVKENKLDKEKSREKSSSSAVMESEQVPLDFEISSTSNIFDTKDNEIEKEKEVENKIFEDSDSGREISYLPLNQSIELVKDKFENSRTLLVTDIESDEGENNNDDDDKTVSQDIREFVPSKWNQTLTPQKPAIKSPNTSFESTSVGSTHSSSKIQKSSLKKSVSFERKKTQLFFVTDSDEEEKQQQQKIQPLSTNNGQLNLFLDWELQPDELENPDIHGDDLEEFEFLKNYSKPRSTSNPVMDMYRISGFESTSIPPSRSNPLTLPIPTSSSSTLGELRHTKNTLKLDLNIGEACLLDSEVNDSKTFVGKQQQLDSGVGSSNVSPFNNYCDNH